MRKLYSLIETNRRYFLLTLLAGAVFCMVSVVTPNLSGQLVTTVIEAPADCAVILAAFLAVSVCQLALWALDAYMHTAFLIRQKKTMRTCLFQSFMTKEGSGSREKIGSFISYINNDVPNIAEQYVYGTIDIVKCLLLMALTTASLFSIHWLLAADVLLHCVLISICPTLLKKRSGEARKEYSEKMGKYNACLQSMLSGMHIIRTYCCWPFAQKTYGKAHEGVTKCEFRMLRYYMAVEGAMAFLQISKSATILLLGLFLVIKGDVAIGSLFAVIQLADLLSNPIEYLASLRYARNMMVTLVEKYISSIEESGPVRGEAASAEPLSSLAVEHVSCHAGGLEILKDVSAVFTGRKKYLIEGRSGSGKSTLLQLIGRSSELEYSGKILYNGGDAAALSC